MPPRMWFAWSSATALLLISLGTSLGPACCPAPPRGKPVVNADQTVILIWDPASKTQHFIRKASFKSEAEDFGFLVPSPSQPELEESGNEAFPYLLKVTEPEVKQVPRPSGGGGCGCYSSTIKGVALAPQDRVTVLEEKTVAGFKAVVLEATSATALVNWLKEHDYAYSPEIEAWAKPYIDGGWKITALKVAKNLDEKDKKTVAASALRISFKTDRPLFPYREPDSKSYADALGAKNRLLRIYFIGEARYQGELTKDTAWTGKVAWTDKLKPESRKKLLEMLKLPENTGPAEWWLTEFEDDWPYRVAPADVYFSRAGDQSPVKREPIIQYVSLPIPTDATIYALAAALIVPPVWRKIRRQRKG